MAENALIVAEKIDAQKVFFGDGMDAVLSQIRAKIDEFEGDAETEEGRKEIVSMAYKVSRSKTFLDSIRKELIADAKKKIEQANGSWNPAKKQLDAWRDEVRQPVTDYEAEQERIEEKRVAVLREKVDLLRCINIPDTTEGLNKLIYALERTQILDTEYFEFLSEAERIHEEKLTAAKAALTARIKADEEAARQKAEAERLAKEREEQERIKSEQEEAQRKIDEANRKIDEEKAEIRAEKERAKERLLKSRLEQLKDVVWNGHEALDSMDGNLVISYDGLLSCPDRCFDKFVENRNAKVSKRNAEREALEKAEAEKKAKEEAQRIERLKPDKEKLEAFAQFLEEGIEFPEVQSEEANRILTQVEVRLSNIVSALLKTIETIM